MLPRPVVISLAVVVTLGWFLNLLSYLVYSRGDPQVNLLFGIVLGAVFGLNRAVGGMRRRATDMLKPVDRDLTGKGDPS